MASEIFNEATNGTPLSNCTNRRDHTAEILAFCWILVVSLTGNVLIGMIVFETKAWLTATNCLIVNMSVSDLLYLIFVSITSCSDMRRWLRSTGTEHLHSPSSIAVRLHFCFHQEPCLIWQLLIDLLLWSSPFPVLQYKYVCNGYLLHLDNGNSLVLPNIIAHLRHREIQWEAKQYWFSP